MTLAQTLRLHHRIQCLNYCDRLRFGDRQLDVLRLMTNGNVSDEQIAPVVTAICAEPMRWADFMMRFELGLDPPNPKRALHAATIGGFDNPNIKFNFTLLR
jgi:hypothetical protein